MMMYLTCLDVFLLMLTLVFLQDAECFFVKHVDKEKCIKDTSQIQSSESYWGSLSYVELSSNCLDPAAQFRFRDNGAMLNLKRQGCLAAYFKSHDYGGLRDMFYIYVAAINVSMNASACAQNRAITQTSGGALSVFYKGKDKIKHQTWCAVPATYAELAKNRGIDPYLGLTTACEDAMDKRFNFGSVTCHGNFVRNANCPKDQYMVVKSAYYRGLPKTKTCGLSNDYICQVDATCLVKKQCDGGLDCNIMVDDSVFSVKLCHGLTRYLYFEYQCIDTPIPTAICSSVTCHGSMVRKACLIDQYMVVKTAFFRGLPATKTVKTCGLSNNYSCQVDSTCLVKKQCDGQHECNIKVDDSVFSAKLCHGLTRYLYFEYHCIDTPMPTAICTVLPGKPRKLTITNIMSRSAKISWMYPENEGYKPVRRFWIKAMKENILILNTTTMNVHQYDINNLTPHTRYEISLAAGNGNGFGEEVSTSFLTSEGTDENCESCGIWFIGTIVLAILLFILLVVFVYFVYRNRLKSSTTNLNLENETNGNSNSQNINDNPVEDDDGNYEQVDHELENYTALRWSAEDGSGDHEYYNLHEAGENVNGI